MKILDFLFSMKHYPFSFSCVLTTRFTFYSNNHDLHSSKKLEEACPTVGAINKVTGIAKQAIERRQWLFAKPENTVQ